MQILERIISSPIFFQISIFGIQLAIILFQFEHVSKNATIFFVSPPASQTIVMIFFEHLQNANHLSFEFVYHINEAIYFPGENYLLCYFITTISINALAVADMAYNILWYHLAHHEQFIVQTIIRRSQDPFELKGLGVFVCSLETYLTVAYKTL